jgi:hypothetical protein
MSILRIYLLRIPWQGCQLHMMKNSIAESGIKQIVVSLLK